MIKLTSFLLIAFFQLLSLFPIRLLRWFGRLLGGLLWITHSRSRKVTEENLALCFPDMASSERTQLARNSLQHLGMTALELGPIWRRPVKKLLSNVVKVEGLEYLEQGMAKGKGIIVLPPHIGAWELLGLYIAEKFPVTTLYQPPDNPAMHDLIVNARTRNSSGLAPTNTKGVKILLQALKRGEIIGILPDQVPPLEGAEFAPFFEIPALTTVLVKNLARRTGAMVVTGCALRDPSSGNFHIIYEVVPEDIYSQDTLTSLIMMNKKVEDCVMRAPEQYQWEYKRFKKQPVGEKKYYQ
jgi:KDO2-lipid IV(A) lauroyltransferase